MIEIAESRGCGEEIDWLAVMMREASISMMLLLAGLSHAVSVAER